MRPRLFARGNAHRGQFGTGRLERSDDWVRVAGSVKDVKSHTGHALLLTDRGEVQGTGGNIYGPSAGTAILACIVSAVTGKKIRQDVAVTGEISLAGRVRPVGGVFEKAYGARQAGIKTLVIPKENERDIPEDLLGLDIHAVETAEEAFQMIFEGE